MAKYTNNEKDGKISVNTYSYTDKNIETGTAVAIKFFDTMCAVSIHLQNEGDNKQQVSFDWDHGVTAYLGTKECKLFSKKGYKHLSKYEDSGEFDTLTLPLKKGVIEVTTVANLKKKLKAMAGEVSDPNALCLVIYTEMNEQKIPQSYLVHVFSSGLLLKDYQPESGSYARLQERVAECEYFFDTLKEFSKSMTNAVAHAIKNDGKYARDKWEKMAYELAIALGIDLGKSSAKVGNGQKSLSWDRDQGSGDSGIGTRGNPSQHIETIDADEAEIDTIIKSMMDNNE